MGKKTFMTRPWQGGDSGYRLRYSSVCCICMKDYVKSFNALGVHQFKDVVK